MSSEYLYGQLRLASRKRWQWVTTPVQRGAVPSSGRIKALSVGQGTGFIELAAGVKVFFHRADLEPPTSINSLELGDSVQFDLVEDHVSGSRAVRVRRLGAIRGSRI
jgi:cold shock CspA family protein